MCVLGKSEISQYISEVNRIQGTLAERERAVQLKKEEYRKKIAEIPDGLCEQLEVQYGISLKRFMVDLDGLSMEEIKQLQGEAEEAIEKIKLVLGRTFERIRGE